MSLLSHFPLVFLGVVVVVHAYGSSKLGIGCSTSFMAMVKGPMNVMILFGIFETLGLYFSIATHNTMCIMKMFTLNVVQQSGLLGFLRISFEEEQKK